MRLTDFRRLRHAVANLDVHFITNSIVELWEQLDGNGLKHDPNNVVVTEEGIYYINPNTGMATKVALYIPEQRLKPDDFQMRRVGEFGYEEKEEIDTLNEYHLLRCNLVTHYEIQGWKQPFRVAQRTDGRFSYKLIATMDNRRVREEVYQDLENQELNVCSNCLIKINSLLDNEGVFTRESFLIKYFFDSGFKATWSKKARAKRDRGVLSDLYPKDRDALTQTRKQQVEYVCEECASDLSDPSMQQYIYVHHTGHLSDKISYVRFRCLCVGCLAHQPGGDRIKDSRKYMEYLRLLRKPPQKRE